MKKFTFTQSLKKIIRNTWLLLPVKIRRYILDEIVFIFSYSLNAKRTLLKGNIVVAGFIGTNSGLGELARQMINQFSLENLNFFSANVSRFAILEDIDAGTLWPKNSGEHGIIIFHVTPDIFTLVAAAIGKKNLIKRRIVGYWNWELETIPKKWIKTLKSVDEVWVPTHFIAEALQKVSGNKPIYVVPGLVDISLTPSKPTYDLLPQFSGKILVFFMYDVRSTHARKNPEAVINTFILTNDQNSVLIIKINNNHAWPESLKRIQTLSKDIPNIHIICEKFTHDEMKNLIARMDIVISLHRSEGYGLLMVEAMAAAKPVIATGWSGNLDFMTPDCSILIDYTLIPVEDPQHCYDKYNAVWAEPNIIQAAEALRRLLNDPAERKRLGDAARAHITDYLSPEKWKKSLPKSFWDSLSNKDY